MNDLKIIRRCEELIRLNGGCTPKQLAMLIEADARKIERLLSAVPGFYIDRWRPVQGGHHQPVYDVVDAPAACPKPGKGEKT